MSVPTNSNNVNSFWHLQKNGVKWCYELICKMMKAIYLWASLRYTDRITWTKLKTR